MWLFVLFLTVPLIEIALFIQVGGWIGLWPTLGIVIVTAILGTWLVRSQGAAELNRLRGSFRELNDPTEPLAHGAMILVSGALLLTPGFFTDAVGFALLVPAFRRIVFNEAKKRIKVTRLEFGERPGQPRGPAGRGDRVILDGEYKDITDDHRKDGPSGWTRH